MRSHRSEEPPPLKLFHRLGHLHSDLPSVMIKLPATSPVTFQWTKHGLFYFQDDDNVENVSPQESANGQYFEFQTPSSAPSGGFRL